VGETPSSFHTIQQKPEGGSRERESLVKESHTRAYHPLKDTETGTIWGGGFCAEQKIGVIPRKVTKKEGGEIGTRRYKGGIVSQEGE